MRAATLFGRIGSGNLAIVGLVVANLLVYTISVGSNLSEQFSLR